jgi:NTP pyrophosphatase (non-canonical NTP hydrolase)
MTATSGVPHPDDAASRALDLDAIETRASAATSGPWVSDEGGYEHRAYSPQVQCFMVSTLPGEIVAVSPECRFVDSANATFIAHAREDVPALVRRVRELEAERDRLATPGSGFDLDAFSAENRARCESPTGFNHALSSWSLSDWMTATLGELGEAANVAKKLNRVRDGIRGNSETEGELRQKLGSEIADAFIYLDLMAQSQGLRLSEIVRRTFDAKSQQIGYVARAQGGDRA